jgi:hypothetical protein
VDRLAKAMIDPQRHPVLHANEEWESNVKALHAVELNEKINAAKIPENPASTRVPAD